MYIFIYIYRIYIYIYKRERERDREREREVGLRWNYLHKYDTLRQNYKISTGYVSISYEISIYNTEDIVNFFTE